MIRIELGLVLMNPYFYLLTNSVKSGTDEVLEQFRAHHSLYLRLCACQ
jgi:hypothetical protein